MSERSEVTKWHPVGGSMARLVIFSAALCWALPALAEDAAQRRAREELERQLHQLVEKAPSRVRVEFQPLEDPNLEVEELELAVDGAPLKAPAKGAISGWVQDGPMPVAAVDVSPGRHKVVARATVHHTASPLVTDEGDHRWKLSGEVTFEVAQGIEVKVVVSPVRDASQRDVGKRLRLVFPSQPVMIAKLDDGSMPEPTAVKPKLVADAGALAAADPNPDVKVAATTADEKRLEQKRLAAEERQRKADAAKEQKRLAAEEKQRKADEAKERKRLAAEEKQRMADEAKERQRLAAEEQQRKTTEAKDQVRLAADARQRKADEAKEQQRLADDSARLAAAEEAQARADDLKGRAEAVLDASHAEAAVSGADAGQLAATPLEPAVDGGATVAAAAASPPEGAAPAEPTEGPPWLVIGGIGAALALAVVVLLAKRSGRVPTLEE